MQQSMGIGFSTIMKCMESGELIMGVKPSDWRAPDGAVHQDLEMFLARQLNWRKGLNTFGAEALRGYATSRYSDLLMVMADWKMRVNVPPDFGPYAVYMISQLREKMLWVVPGELDLNRYTWPVFTLDNKTVPQVRFWSHGFSGNPVVQVATQEGDTVYMLRWDEPLTSYSRMLKHIENVESTLDYSRDGYTGVTVPCVHAELDPDLSWLLGMRNSGWFVAYAKQMLEFGMNHLGFAQREETVMVTMKCVMAPPKIYTISPEGESFLFWRRREGVAYPISMFQFGSADFKDPGDLNAIVR